MTAAARRPGWPGRLALRAAAGLALGYVLLPLVLISWLPRRLLQELRVLAKDRDVPYQSLMKVLLAEKVSPHLSRRADTRRCGRSRLDCRSRASLPPRGPAFGVRTPGTAAGQRRYRG